MAEQLPSFSLNLCPLGFLMSWCSVWHPIQGSLSHLEASYRERQAARKCCGFACLHHPADVHCDSMYANLPACAVPPPHSTRLQYQPSAPPLQPARSCSISTQLSPPSFHNRNTVTCPCARVAAHSHCSWKGGLVTLSKAIERLWVFLLKREVFHSGARTLSCGALMVVKPLLEEYTSVCVCVCMQVCKNVWKVSSFQKIWAHVCLYIVGLNLAHRYCVYLAALFCTKLVWMKQKFIWSPCKNLCDLWWCWSLYSIVQGGDFIFIIFFLL